MERQGRLLIVENELKDLKRAAESALLAGFSEVEGKSSPQAAMDYLEDQMSAGGELPDGILLDLDFGQDSGYELLRYWHSNPRLHSIPVIVWSILGDDHKTVCNLFKIKHFIGKWEGNEVLQEALKSIAEPAG